MKPFKLGGSALFCEDLRDEVQGSYSIIGVFSDRLAVPSFPSMLSKFAMYARITFDPHEVPDLISVDLSIGGELVASSPLSREMLETTAADCIASDTGIATLLTRITSTPFNLPAPLKITAVLSTNQEKFILGTLQIELAV